MSSNSKSLNHDDLSGFEFAKEMLDGNETAGINFDRIQKLPDAEYIIFEYLLCEEDQSKSHNTTPHTSHPNKYWFKNKEKFIKLWEVSQALNSTLYLINYAKIGTKYDDEILIIKVLDLNADGIQDEEITKMNRQEFKLFFRKLNTECLGKIPCQKCGSPLKLINGPYGDFYGCSDYKNNGCMYKQRLL